MLMIVLKENMLNLVKQMGCTDPKFGKGGHHGFHTLIGHGFSNFIDKQFSYLKNNNPSILNNHKVQNYSTTSAIKQVPIEINSSPQKQDCLKNNTSSNGKRKKKRRRKKKSKIQNSKTTNCRYNGKEIFTPVRRERQVSVAESEDSFVVFFEGENDERISELSDDDDGTEYTEETYSSDSTLPHKKVRFADDKKLCEIHPMIMWSFAYQAARKGPWEEHARDRDRFAKRIFCTEMKIRHILDDDHRNRIFEERFASDRDF